MSRNLLDNVQMYLYDLTIGQMKAEMKTELKAYITDLDDIIIVALLIGFFCIITGNRKAGTKITSFSIMIYLITKAVLITYVG